MPVSVEHREAHPLEGVPVAVVELAHPDVAVDLAVPLHLGEVVRPVVRVVAGLCGDPLPAVHAPKGDRPQVPGGTRVGAGPHAAGTVAADRGHLLVGGVGFKQRLHALLLVAGGQVPAQVEVVARGRIAGDVGEPDRRTRRAPDDVAVRVLGQLVEVTA